MKYLLTATIFSVALVTACSKPMADDASNAAASGTPASAPAVAASAPKKLAPPPSNEAPTPAQINQRLVQRYDANQDGTVSAQEMLDVTVNNLLRFSGKKDRTLSSAEFHAAMGDKTGKDQDIEKVFTTADTDKNKILDDKELSTFAWPSIQSLMAQPLKK